jgi:hypothetical protein
MNEELDVEDNTNLLLPRPWLEPAVEEVREIGPLTIWTCAAGRTYVKGFVGTKRLVYWHRIVPLPRVAARVARLVAAITPM